MTARKKRTATARSIPFPLFLLMVCAAVTIGATSLRALGGGAGAPSMTSALAGTAGRVMAFLDYFAGVFCLLSLTAAVVCGLAATDRLVLSIKQRVAMQSVHRATAVAALGFLVVHIAVKVAEQEASPLVVLLPFSGGATFAVSIGTISADLLVLTAATGAVRGRFANSRRPWLWRLLHGGAYACWPIALAHGLTAGRAAATYVLWSYGSCAALVALALMVRVLSSAERRSARKRTDRTLLAHEPSRSAWSGAADEELTLAVHAQLPSAAKDPVESVTEPVTVPLVEPVAVPEPVTATMPVAVPVAMPEPQYVPDQYQQQYMTQPQPQYVPYAEQVPYPQPVAYAEHVQYPGPDQYGYQPEYADAYSALGGYGPVGGYGYPSAPSPWAGDGNARPHPALAETPPHGFAVPTNLFATPYYVPDSIDDSGAWSALTWDTPPYGVPVQAAPGREHGGGW
ncbi:hypothetical protein [Streptacidiphilus carbonis]|uniref:hypothetical protein n=1 Tax=Streptacidiphilus carbonis TaxID=105422 RepID=UPI001269C321|nr:hypothetical protein [Streptacidiphilus carbonis]